MQFGSFKIKREEKFVAHFCWEHAGKNNGNLSEKASLHSYL